MEDSAETRLARIETQLEAILAEQVETRKEVKKFNDIVAWSRGAIFAVLGLGSAALWLWSQVKGLILK